MTTDTSLDTELRTQMLDLNLQGHRFSRTKLGGVVEHVLAVQAANGNRAANEALLDAVGVMLKTTRNDAYYGEALSYHLALISSRLADPESVRTYMQQSHTMPAGGGDTLFTEHVLESIRVREMQERAMARGVPSILMTTMPRSASATLALSLSQMLGTPLSRVSVGDFPDYVLVPSWLRIFLEGGSVNHDHFGAGKFNLRILDELAVRDLFVLVRDPRAAAASAVRLGMQTLQAGAPAHYSFEEHVTTVLKEEYLPWLRGWLACAAGPASHLRVHWLFWEDVRTRLPVVVNRICRTIGTGHPSIRPFANVPEVRANFVTGDGSSWRRDLSEATQRSMWELLDPQVIDLLGLEF